MIRLLCFLAGLLGVSVAASWLAQHAGSVEMDWLGYRVETSVALLLVVVLGFTLLAAAVVRLAFRLSLLPSRWRSRRSVKQYKIGLQAVTRSIVALAANDVGEARAQARKAERQLGATPLTLLLTAQAARAEGKDAETQELLEQMLAHEDTRYVAARSLSEQAGKRREYTRALGYAEQAVQAHPKEKAALLSLIGLYTKQGMWEEAEAAIQRALRRGALIGAQAKRLKALLMLSRAGKLQATQPEQALHLARGAQRALPDFPPALALLAECERRTGERAETLKRLQKAWKLKPHSDLLSPALDLLAQDTPAQAIKTMRKLVTGHANAPESHLAVARMAARVREWQEAKREAMLAVNVEESEEACRLMAEILTQGYHDEAEANRWLLRAANAPCAAYACLNCHHSGSWQLHCPQCDAFDRMEWLAGQPRLAV